MLQFSVLESAKPVLSSRTLVEMFCVCTVLHGSHQPHVTIEYATKELILNSIQIIICDWLLFSMVQI